MKVSRLTAILPLLNLVWAHDGTPGQWRLTAFSGDQSCANIGYVSLDGGLPCPKNPSCKADSTDEGDFFVGVKTDCVTDKDGFLLNTFKGAPYFMIVTSSSGSFCSDDEPSTNVLGFLADGKCHPYKTEMEDRGHFVVEKDAEGTVTVLLTSSGCDSKSWGREYVAKAADLGTGNCTEIGKVYLINDNSSTATTATGKSESSIIRSMAALATAMTVVCAFLVL